MIIRIGVAICALVWIHGLDRTREDVGAAASAMKADAPRAALAYCATNATLCQQAALGVVTGTTTSDARAGSGERKAGIDPESEPMPVSAGRLLLPAGSVPLPPRRPRS